MYDWRLSNLAKEDLRRIYYRINGKTIDIMAILGSQAAHPWLP